jgi:D-ribose pyranase
MLKDGLLNPAINHLLSRVRHTNFLLISDRGFPTLPQVETVDISLVADMPRVLDVLRAVRANFQCRCAVMSAEFRELQTPEVQSAYGQAMDGLEITWIPHLEFKQKALQAIGIIRTGDTTRFGNILLESS